MLPSPLIMLSTGRVIKTCFTKGGVPAAIITRWIDDGEADEIELENLAMMLAGIISDTEVARHLYNEKINGDQGGGGEAKTESEGRDDPLTPARPD